MFESCDRCVDQSEASRVRSHSVKLVLKSSGGLKKTSLKDPKVCFILVHLHLIWDFRVIVHKPD